MMNRLITRKFAMSLKALKLTFIPLFCLISNLSYADLSAKDLLEDCQVSQKLEDSKAGKMTTEQAFQRGACAGYIKGFDDMEIIYSSILAGPNGTENDIKKYSLYCLPKGTKSMQMVQVIIDYLQKHPTQLNDPANLAVARAFRDHFPCKK
jgi:hypothetical protein